MARRWFSSLDVRERKDGRQVVDLRGTTGRAKELERKEILLGGYYGAFGTTSLGVTGLPGRPWDLARATREGYARVVWVYRCVEAYAGKSSRLPIIGQSGPEDEPEPVDSEDIPALRLLQPNAQANPLETGKVYRKRLSMQVLLSSRGTFTFVKTSRGGTPLEYRLLPPNRVRIWPAKDGSIDHFQVLPARPGERPRPLDPDKVRWVREPHPDDPYVGMTPLEAAGLSIELDHFTRLFNRSAVANEGRPGMVIGIEAGEDEEGELDPREAERIERRFGGGVLDANRTVVVDGKVTAIDMSGTPRDGSWLHLGKVGREEIMAAFATSPVILGLTSEQTFANASEGRYSWYAGPFSDHLDTVDDTWQPDAPQDDIRIRHDTSGIVELDVARKARRTEAREEVKQGRRSPLSYAKLAGLKIGDEPGDFPDNAATRALWQEGGGVPIPLKPEDEEELKRLQQVGLPPGASGGDFGGGFSSGGDGAPSNGPDSTGLGPSGSGDGLSAYAPIGGADFGAAGTKASRERRLRAIAVGDEDDGE